MWCCCTHKTGKTLAKSCYPYIHRRCPRVQGLNHLREWTEIALATMGLGILVWTHTHTYKHTDTHTHARAWPTQSTRTYYLMHDKLSVILRGDNSGGDAKSHPIIPGLRVSSDGAHKVGARHFVFARRSCKITHFKLCLLCACSGGYITLRDFNYNYAL